MTDAVVVNQRSDAFDVDIGRGTPFGNPFTHIAWSKGVIVVGNRETAIARYYRWLTTDEEIPGWPKPTRAQIMALAGKRLGCWCKPRACHGDVLAELIREWSFVGVAVTPEPTPIKPFLRWVGAKRWLAPTLAPWITARRKPGGVYCEPFLGAGAVALGLPSGTPMRLGDRCASLSGLWWWIARDPLRVHGLMPTTADNNATRYKEMVEAFNKFGHYSPVSASPSALMLWLNHTCFNGVYRENRAGGFNVPWGKRKTIALPTLVHLTNVRNQLYSADIRVGADYADTIAGLPPGSVIYADPPYHGTFVDYTSSGFGDTAQAGLAGHLTQLAADGHTVATTNSDTPLIRELYPVARWNVQNVSEPRSVAARSSSRKSAPCLLITSR